MLRLFCAVDVGDAVRARISRELHALQAIAPHAKWVKPENVHVTLAFLGSVEDEKVPGIKAALDGACGRHAPLRLEIGGGGSFGQRSRPKVLWVGVGGQIEALGRVFADVEDALVPFGYQKESRDFHPHLTVARSRELRGDRELAACVQHLAAFERSDLDVTEVLLMKSTLGSGGPKYEVLHRAALASR